MSKCRITVLRRMYNEDFAEQYTQSTAPKCDSFEDGQVFIVENMVRPPEDFCAWAWIDLQRSIQTLLRGGNFSDTGWMKKDNVLIACCSDGIRPVVFKIERMDEITQ
ncbi:MAG: TIGR04076 family protein [Candidatus Kapabacteria bacterium]|nr:TIGR04076 family protein [Candidatus Kapabacteria bacterium]